MDDQAKVNESRVNGSAEGVVGSIADFGNNVATLAELQLKLAAIDFKEMLGQAAIPFALVTVALTVILGSVPVAIGGVAYLVAQWLSITIGWALLLTAGVTMLLAGVIVVFAGRRVGTSLNCLRRSNEELIRNVSWIRTVMLYSGRAVPKRRW